MKSRFVQLGWLTAGIGAGFVLLTGTALAETAPGQVNSNQTSTNVVIKDGSAAVAKDSNVAVASDTKVTTSVTSEVEQTGAASTPPNITNDSGTSQSSINVESSVATGVTSPGDGSNQAQPGSSDQPAAGETSQALNNGDSATQLSNFTPAQTTAMTTAIARAVAAQSHSDFKPQQLTRPAASLATGPTDSSKGKDAPKSPAQSGVLLDLDQLLSSRFIPASRQLDVSWPISGLALAIPLTLALCLALGFKNLNYSSFIGHLRRSGFSHAARSDLVSPILYFVTPQAVSLRVAASPPIGSLFGGVQNKHRIYKTT